MECFGKVIRFWVESIVAVKRNLFSDRINGMDGAQESPN